MKDKEAEAWWEKKTINYLLVLLKYSIYLPSYLSLFSLPPISFFPPTYLFFPSHLSLFFPLTYLFSQHVSVSYLCEIFCLQWGIKVRTLGKKLIDNIEGPLQYTFILYILFLYYLIIKLFLLYGHFKAY